MRATICLALVGLLMGMAVPSLAEGEDPAQTTSGDTIEIIQLRDPFEAEPLEEKVQKYFNLDTTYDYEEETTSIWTTLGFRKDVFDISLTWDQQVNPSEPGTATLSLNFWW